MTEQMMDITPHPALLLSLRGERIDYGLLIGEACDNTFDAGGRTISIKITNDNIEFADDGVGITRDRMRALFSLGVHGAMPTTNLGRFGVGIKSQVVNAGDTLEVQSVSKDGRMHVTVDWRSVLRSHLWQIPLPRWAPVDVTVPTGATITIGKLRKPPASMSLDRIRDELALVFHPALTEGCRITVNAIEVPALAEPKMTDIIEQQLPLSNGRSAHLRAGILVQTSGRLHHVHVGYKHRIIKPGSSVGCAAYGGLNKMFARLQLSGPWHFAKFKNDLTDAAELEELEAAVEEALRPILEKCNTASLSARLDTLLDMVNDMLPTELVAARPRRKNQRRAAEKKRARKSKAGTVKPNEAEPNGPATTPRPRHDRIIITFDGVADEHGIGYYQSGRPHRVNLSRDDPDIAKLLALRDQSAAARSIYLAAIMLFEQGRTEHSPPLPFESFGKRVAKLLTLQDDDHASSATA